MCLFVSTGMWSLDMVSMLVCWILAGFRGVWSLSWWSGNAISWPTSWLASLGNQIKPDNQPLLGLSFYFRNAVALGSFVRFFLGSKGQHTHHTQPVSVCVRTSHCDLHTPLCLLPHPSLLPRLPPSSSSASFFALHSVSHTLAARDQLHSAARVSPSAAGNDGNGDSRASLCLFRIFLLIDSYNQDLIFKL